MLEQLDVLLQNKFNVCWELITRGKLYSCMCVHNNGRIHWVRHYKEVLVHTALLFLVQAAKHSFIETYFVAHIQ